jgi:hypothetical protein
MLRGVDSPPPNLFEGRVPKIGSKGWVPRSTAGRVGALIIGAVYVAAGLVAIIATPRFKDELRTSISSPAVGILVSVLAIATVLAAASAIIFLGSRIIRGAFRMAPTAKHNLDRNL